MRGDVSLETEGTIYLEARSGNEKLELKKGANVELGFHFEKEKPGMQTFLGSWKDDKIDWTLDNIKDETEECKRIHRLV